ncbi:transcription factor SPT20 homolog [Sorex araneus]|uniref:transcription factor SPT20 homolog n=1 Tax=Sorex araneus TaxID=42254 RepID=UPI002433BB4B|nr:transcription factor SPT20 homolog [Sorex araneus]
MQQPLEQALDQAESIIESAQRRPPKQNSSSDGEKSLHQKLYDIYVEECEKESPAMQGLKSNVNLLEKLVKRESLPCLIVNLYPGKEGYSLMLKEKNGSCSESIHLPYEEAELLEYFDAEELPPILVSLLDKSKIDIFHSGCVITEIRDYRQVSDVAPPGYHSRHILLRPTMQTLACDVQSIASNSKAWSQEDKLLLESQLLLATAEPLCLDPSVAVACTENRLLYNKQKMNTRPMKGNLKRYSASSLNRQQELSGCSPPPELSMVSSCKRSKGSREVPQYDLKVSEGSYVDTWKQRPCDLAVPSEVDVEKYAKGKKPVTYSVPAVLPAQEVKDGSGSGCDAGTQSQTGEPIFVQSPSNPVSAQRSCTEARCERPLSPPQSSTDDHSQSTGPESKPDPGSLVGPSEELVQRDTVCPDTVSTGSSGSASLSLLSQGAETFQSDALLIPSSILEMGSDYSDLILPSSSEDSSSWNTFTPEQTRSFFSFLSPDPASQPPAPPQTSSVEVNSVHVAPTAALSTSSQTSQAMTSDDSSSQATPDPPTVKPAQRPQAPRGAANSAGPSIIHVVSAPQAAPSSVSDSNSVPGSVSVATAPAGLTAASTRFPCFEDPAGAQRPAAAAAAAAAAAVSTDSGPAASSETRCCPAAGIPGVRSAVFHWWAASRGH